MTSSTSLDARAADGLPRSVLVTGGSGFVGRQVVRRLLDQGVQTTVLCRARAAATSNTDSRIHEIRTSADVFAEPQNRLAQLVSGFDILVHCAWCTDRSDYLSSLVNTCCLEGTIRLAQAFAATGGKRFVGLGTCAEYDNSAGILTAATPLRPSNLYAATKAAAYLVLNNLLPPLGVSFAWCRLFYLFGEGERADRLVPTVRRLLEQGMAVSLTEGTQVRDFMDVRDAGRMIAETALADKEGVFNICSGVGTTIRALVESIADEFGRRDLLRFGSRTLNAFDPQCIIGSRG